MKGTKTYNVVSNLLKVTQLMGGGIQSPAWCFSTPVDIGSVMDIKTDSVSAAPGSGTCHFSSSRGLSDCWFENI